MAERAYRAALRGAISIDYVCQIDTEADLEVVVARVKELFGGELENPDGPINLTAPSMFINVYKMDERSREWAQEDWGVSPWITVSIRVKKFLPEEQDAAAYRELSLGVVRLVEGLKADAILLLEQDRMLMRRKSGVLTLFDWWRDWVHPDVVAGLRCAAGHVFAVEEDQRLTGRSGLGARPYSRAVHVTANTMKRRLQFLPRHP